MNKIATINSLIGISAVMSKQFNFKPILAALGTSFILSMAVNPIVSAGENPSSLQILDEYKQELLQDLVINVENQFHNDIDEMQKFVQSSEVIDKESNKKPVNYFSIISVIVNDALNLGSKLKTSVSLN